MMTLSERLIGLREAMGFSLTQLAKRSGISRGYLYLLEQGTSSPTLDVLVKLANVYSVHVSDLLRPCEFVVFVDSGKQTLPFDDSWDGLRDCEKCGNDTTGQLCHSCAEQEAIDRS
jgi:transcriptional regulator with XRE-family HTH domain